MVYKVCEFRGLERIKISEETEKSTIPGSKYVLRNFENGKPTFDILCLASEDVGSIKFGVDRVTGEKHACSELKKVTHLLFADGKRQVEDRTLAQKKQMLKETIVEFGSTDLIAPGPTMSVFVSEKLHLLTNSMI